MHKFYIYPGNYSYLIKEGLLRRGNWQEDNENSNPFMDCNFIWKPTNLSISEYNKLDGITKTRSKNFVQVFNHFENIRGICTKTGLVRSLKKYYQTNADASNANYKAFDSTPTSFLITAGVEDSEYASFVARYKQIAKHNFVKEAIPQKHCEGNYWLVKPANLNQGRGIEVFKNLKDINSFLNTRPNNSFWVVQKYVEHPLLYRNRKFDIRVWVVVTTKNEIFLYKNAYIRTSSDDYDLKTSKNYVHLTNNCLQQHGDMYGKHEDGNTLPLSTLDEYLKEAYPGLGVNLAEHIIPRIKDLIIDTFQCSPNLNPCRRKNVFEFFGFDFLIDEDLRTWLIEINTNPYLGTPNTYIGNLLPLMIDDMLEIAVDPLFPPKNKPRNDGRPNDYELIYCEQGSSYHNGPLNVRTPFNKNVYPIQSLIPPDFQKKLAHLARSHEPIRHYYEFMASHPEEAHENRVNDEVNGNATTQPRSPSLEVRKTNAQAHDKNNIDSIYKQLCLMIPYKTDVGSNVAGQIGRVMSYIKNWELLSKKDVKTACKALLLIAEAAGNALLEEQSTILTIAKLLRSHEVKSEIKMTLIETINILAKDIYLRKKLICNHILQNLITICLSSCEEKTSEEHSKGFLMATLKCLVNLGCIFNRKLYIPGETREAAKLRGFFIAQGGVIALWIISQRSIDTDMKEYCSKHFLNLLESSDYEKQLQVLDLASSMPNGVASSDTNVSSSRKEIGEENKEGEMDAVFFRTGEFQAIEKVLNLKGDQNSKYLGKVIQFTKEMLNVLPLEKLKQEFTDYIVALKEESERREKREAEERERRQIAEIEKLKKEEIKKKDLDDQRRAALDSFEKRVLTMLKKQQFDNERRQKELEEIKQKEMEARRKNIEMLMSKKADREKRQKRVRSQKNPHKKFNNRTYSEDSHEEEQQNVKYYELKTGYSSVNAKNKSHIGALGSGSPSPILHQQVFVSNTDTSMRRGTNVEKGDDSVEEVQRALILGQTDFVKSDSNRSSPSQLQKDSNIPGNVVDSPRNLKGIHYLTGGIPKGILKAEDLNQSENATKENIRNKSRSQCRLPKLQKASQNAMMERIAQSPYLKTTVNKRVTSFHVRT